MIARPTDSRTSILDAAEELFAARGFAATTIKQIGEKSGQNTSLIYYYYDSKATLYKHVLDRLFGDIVAEGTARIEDRNDPESVVRAIVGSQIAVLSRHAHLPALVTREILDSNASHAEHGIRTLTAALFDRLRDAVERGQTAGIFRRELDPRFSAISTVAQVAYLMLARPIAGIVLGRGPGGPNAEDLRAFGAHAADFALAALRRPGASEAPPARAAAGPPEAPLL